MGRALKPAQRHGNVQLHLGLTNEDDIALATLSRRFRETASAVVRPLIRVAADRLARSARADVTDHAAAVAAISPLPVSKQVNGDVDHDPRHVSTPVTIRMRSVAPLVLACLSAGCADEVAPSIGAVTRLEAGVTDAEVRDLLGEPTHPGLGSKPNWHYHWRRLDGDIGECHFVVVFDERTAEVESYFLRLGAETIYSWPHQQGSPSLTSPCLVSGGDRTAGL